LAIFKGKNAIDIKDVHFSYNGTPIFSGINIPIALRDFIAVIGPNGGGKTTLLKLILGTLSPQSGEIAVFGEKHPKSSFKIGYVPQNVSSVENFPISVMDVVLMGRLGNPGRSFFYGKNDKRIVQEKLEKVDMWDYRSEQVLKLSGGQRQRVYIARALAANPEILLMDEPTSSVDVEGQLKIYNTLRELNREITIVVISHDISLIMGYAKKVAYVNRSLYLHQADEIHGQNIAESEELSFGHFCTVDLLKKIMAGEPHIKEHIH